MLFVRPNLAVKWRLFPFFNIHVPVIIDKLYRNQDIGSYGVDVWCMSQKTWFQTAYYEYYVISFGTVGSCGILGFEGPPSSVNAIESRFNIGIIADYTLTWVPMLACCEPASANPAQGSRSCLCCWAKGEG